MAKLEFRYQLEENVVAIEDLHGGLSVLMLADEVLAQIEAQTGPLQYQHVFWKGDDDLWDMLLPGAERMGDTMAFYPLGGRTLTEAKARLVELMAKGLIPEKIT